MLYVQLTHSPSQIVSENPLTEFKYRLIKMFIVLLKISD
jgi:hypothetical protein